MGTVPPKNENKFDIVCFPITEWNFRYQRTQHILSRFAQQGHRVFHLPVNLQPQDGDFTITKITNNIFHLDPNCPREFNIYEDVWNKKTIRSITESIVSAVNHFDIDGICFVAFPSWAPLALRLKDLYGWKVVYDCLDEHSGFSNVNQKRIVEEEHDLLRKSDLSIATSLHIHRKIGRIRGSDLLFLPNACEFSHFNYLPQNNLLNHLRKPIIGYYGAIAEWFDSDLVEFLAQERPHWSFVFIGHTFGSDICKLKKYGNVHFLGEKPYADLPKYLYHFDVCVIPFRITPLIKATHPVKFYEYVASGKPVVTTRIPELLQFATLCYIAEGKKDFLLKLEAALKEEDEELRRKRIEFARRNTWDARFCMLYSHLQKF